MTPNQDKGDGMRALSSLSWLERPFEEVCKLPDTLVVDCSHATPAILTHHKRNRTPVALRGDSSTDACLNALRARSPLLARSRYVACNHYDIDAFLSVWVLSHPHTALRHERLLRRAAAIGDFRELRPSVVHGDGGGGGGGREAWEGAEER